ncbi:MAG: OmpA family protein [Pseudomonadota bacterium]
MSFKNTLTFLAAIPLCLGGAFVAADWIEDRTGEVIEEALIESGHDWSEVITDGLLVTLSGIAPNEAARFQAVSLAGQSVDSDRIINRMDVRPTQEYEAPEFSVEMLRNDNGISLIGLVPGRSNREDIVAALQGVEDVAQVTDLLESAEYEQPEGWQAAVNFATEALRELPQSKVSAKPGGVAISAISTSVEDKSRIETFLRRRVPSGIALAMDITAPRPVISPFTLRYSMTAQTSSFDACSADTDATAQQILSAARAVGYEGSDTCDIGLGMPSPHWGKAVETALKGLRNIGGGTLTISDADVTLVALDATPQSVFDRVVGDLDAQLPDVFSLHAILPEQVVVDGTGDKDEFVEFVATRSPEGLVQLRGRLPDDEIEKIVGAYARATFGSEAVYLATRDDEDLPPDWPVRVLAALEALGLLENGSVVVQPDYVEVRGISGSKDTPSVISRLLGDKLGEAANFDLNIRYDELLDPVLNIPTPEECIGRINAILAANKIEFEPSSAELTDVANDTMDQIAAELLNCRRTRIEIGGHTDSQGRESMNLNLSQQRADAILAALMDRRILTRNITAKGYGETQPIADNDTEEGRDINRRIEFKLLTDEGNQTTDEAQAPEADSSETASE